jgi:hypothetical protein
MTRAPQLRSQRARLQGWMTFWNAPACVPSLFQGAPCCLAPTPAVSARAHPPCGSRPSPFAEHNNYGGGFGACAPSPTSNALCVLTCAPRSVRR